MVAEIQPLVQLLVVPQRKSSKDNENSFEELIYDVFKKNKKCMEKQDTSDPFSMANKGDAVVSILGTVFSGTGSMGGGGMIAGTTFATGVEAEKVARRWKISIILTSKLP